MEENWTYTDLIDLEYCLSLDTNIRQADLHERDRQIYLDIPDELKNSGRSRLIRSWLETRKKQIFGETAAKSPGNIVTESYRTLAYLLSMLGIMSGFLAGVSFLAYSGTTPVNVLNFLFIFIFSQLLVLAIIFPALCLRMAGFSAIPAPIVSLYGLISNYFATRFTRLTTHLPAETRATASQVAGLWKKQSARYRQIAYWPLFSLSQYTMTGVNAGLLTATVYRLITSDIAFGWQSTIQFTTPFIHAIVRMLALPWSWIVPDQYAYPSEAQIEGSRIILKDGIFHLATQDLVSWWPFLVLCIIVYGLLLRFILSLIGRSGRKRSLRRLQLNTPAHIQLVQRMQSPLVTSQAETLANHNGAHREPVLKSRTAGAEHAACSIMLLIPGDMDGHDDVKRVHERLEGSGFNVVDQRVFMAGYDADQRLVDELAARNWPADTGIAAVMEAWMPPINETLMFMQNLRSAVGTAVPVWVVLAGQPGSDGVPAGPSASERRVWQQKIDELADPYVDLIDL